jgi:hypothetical protein
MSGGFGQRPDQAGVERKTALFAGFSRNPQLDPQLWRNRHDFDAIRLAAAPLPKPVVWTTGRHKAWSILAALA